MPSLLDNLGSLLNLRDIAIVACAVSVCLLVLAMLLFARELRRELRALRQGLASLWHALDDSEHRARTQLDDFKVELEDWRSAYGRKVNGAATGRGEFGAQLEDLRQAITVTSDHVRMSLAGELGESVARVNFRVAQIYQELKADILEVESRLRSRETGEKRPLSAARPVNWTGPLFRPVRGDSGLAGELSKINDRLLPELIDTISGFGADCPEHLVRYFNELFEEIESHGSDDQRDAKVLEEGVIRFVDAVDDFTESEPSFASGAFADRFREYVRELLALVSLKEIEVDVGRELANGEKHQIVGTESRPDLALPNRTIIALKKRGFVRQGDGPVRKPHVVDFFRRSTDVLA